MARARHSPRLLLAEDDPELRGLLAAVLRSDGYDVVEASDGLELLAHLESILEEAGREVDDPTTLRLIVADIHMPGLTGLDVLAIMRCASCRTPVILLTAFGDDETHAEARDLGAAAILDKPFDIDALRAVVRRATAR